MVRRRPAESTMPIQEIDDSRPAFPAPAQLSPLGGFLDRLRAGYAPRRASCSMSFKKKTADRLGRHTLRVEG